MGHNPKMVAALWDRKMAGIIGQKFVRKDKEFYRSLKIIEDILRKFDLSTNEIRIYLYLARSGFPRKAREISDALSLHRTETYKILRALEKRGLISSVFEKPMKFLAVPFEKTIDHLIESKRIGISLLEKRKKDLLHVWYSLPKFEKESIAARVFQILEGKEQVTLKSKEMLEKTEREICVFAPESDLMRFYHWGITDELEEIEKKAIKVRLLTNYSSKYPFFVEKIQLPQIRYNHAPDIKDLPSFIISDQMQVLFCLREDGVSNTRKRERKKKILVLWTNYDSFIRVLKTLFIQLWNADARLNERARARQSKCRSDDFR